LKRAWRAYLFFLSGQDIFTKKTDDMEFEKKSKTLPSPHKN
jgi:hypothetical protein